MWQLRREHYLLGMHVLLCYGLARFLGVAIHEFLGHALTAELLGGSAYAAYVSPGSGFALVFLESPNPWPAALMRMSGILAELAFGLLILTNVARLRSIGQRAFALVFSSVLLVHSSLYLALGAFSPTAGDTYYVARETRMVAASFAFLLAGLVLAAVFSFFISRKVLEHLSPPGESTRRDSWSTLLLFWFLPGLVGTLSAVTVGREIPGRLLYYFVAFTAVGSLLYGWTSYQALRGDFLPRSSGPWKIPLTAALAFALMIPAWVLGFGATEGDAHGIILKSPPLEAERDLADAFAVNLEYHLRSASEVEVRFLARGVQENPSPLEAKLFATFDDRADFSFYRRYALSSLLGASQGGRWEVLNVSISDTVWSGGRNLSNARSLYLSPLPEDVSSVLNEDNGTVTLEFIDPFLFAQAGFIDQVSVSWSANLTLQNATLSAPGSEEFRGPQLLRWRNRDALNSPLHYAVRFR